MSRLNLLQRLSLAYKTSQFPWKKHVMVGWDLDGNEYWEMPNPNNPTGRWKRWVKMKEAPTDVGAFEENQLPVQWQAWLRHTRFEPPTIQDLLADQRRRELLQQKVRQLREAEEQRRQLAASSGTAKETEEQAKEQASAQEQPTKKRKEEQQPSTEPTGHGETFVPGAWSPTSSRR